MDMDIDNLTIGQARHTSGPWRSEPHIGRNLDHYRSIHADTLGQDNNIARTFLPSCVSVGEMDANASLIAAAPDLLAALKAASGYLLNAKIDLETAATKKTAVATIEGGLRVVRAAIAKAEGRP